MICSSMCVYPYLPTRDLDPQEIQLGQASVLAVGLFLVVAGQVIWRLALCI